MMCRIILSILLNPVNPVNQTPGEETNAHPYFNLRPLRWDSDPRAEDD